MYKYLPLLSLTLMCFSASAEDVLDAAKSAFSNAWQKRIHIEHQKVIGPEVQGAINLLNNGVAAPLCGYEDVGFTASASLRFALTQLKQAYKGNFQTTPLAANDNTNSVCVLVNPL